MAPKKNVTDLPVVKKRGRKEKPMKPPLQTPSLITVQFTNSGSKPPKIARSVTCQRKIELANEVALAQLIKSSSMSPKPRQLTPTLKSSVNSPKVVLPSRKKLIPKVAFDLESFSDSSLMAKRPMNSKSLGEVPSKKPQRVRKLALKASETESPLNISGKRKYVKNVTSEHGSEPELLQEPVKKRPGPKSKTINPNPPVTKKKPFAKLLPETFETKPVTVTKTKAGPGKKQPQQPIVIVDGLANSESLEPEEILPVTPAKRVYKRKQPPKKTETEKKDQKEVLKETVAKRVRGRSRNKFVNERADENSTLKTSRTRPINKGKGLNAKQIKTAASMLENALVSEEVPTRSNSVNSSNSNLSWTKDISTASSLASGTTFVTVSSKDFVHFDNKIPFVQVETSNLVKMKVMDEKVMHKKIMDEKELPEKVMEDNIERSLLESESSSSESDPASSDSSDSSNSEYEVLQPELNLSTSSVTKSPRLENKPDNTELLSLEIYKLSNSLKNYYTEIEKYIGFDVDDSCSFSNVLETLELEKDVITTCENFKSILDAINCSAEKTSQEDCERASRQNTELTRKDHKENSPTKNSPARSDQMDHRKTCRNDSEEFAKPLSIRLSVANGQDSQVNSPYINIPTVSDNLNPPENDSAPVTDKSDESYGTFTSNNNNYLTFDKTYDDEDALSLYAESMTGMESSRRGSVASVSNASVQDVYVPKPTSRTCMIEKYNYRPTRIEDTVPRTEDGHMKERIEPTAKKNEPVMIKKQNADSTSITKDNVSDINKTAMDLLTDANRLSSLADNSVKSAKTDEARKPRRLFASYQAGNPVKSACYRGHCFFYIAFQCKNLACRFKHVDINTELIKCRLALLSEDNLIEEYLLTCKFKRLRRKFGLLFIQECKRRKTTRILIEMAIDLGLGVVECEDETLKVNALETTLLHLNTISLDACDDLLKFEHNKRMMCDALLLCMADSQNFAQFKHAFVKLANFLWDIKRPINIEVVGSILERVCILPCDDSLARGMLCLMKNTNATIFENSMTKSFEVHLTNIESDVYDVYLMAKKAAFDGQLAQTAEVIAGPAQNVRIPRVEREGPRHTSPDTTNLENLKKVHLAQPTTFKCTIDTDAIRDLFKSPSNPAPKQRYPVPRLAPWPRGPGYPMRPPVCRGRGNSTHMPGGRRVYRTQTDYRGGDNT